MKKLVEAQSGWLESLVVGLPPGASDAPGLAETSAEIEAAKQAVEEIAQAIEAEDASAPAEGARAAVDESRRNLLELEAGARGAAASGAPVHPETARLAMKAAALEVSKAEKAAAPWARRAAKRRGLQAAFDSVWRLFLQLNDAIDEFDRSFALAAGYSPVYGVGEQAAEGMLRNARAARDSIKSAMDGIRAEAPAAGEDALDHLAAVCAALDEFAEQHARAFVYAAVEYGWKRGEELRAAVQKAAVAAAERVRALGEAVAAEALDPVNQKLLTDGVHLVGSALQSFGLGAARFSALALVPVLNAAGALLKMLLGAMMAPARSRAFRAACADAISWLAQLLYESVCFLGQLAGHVASVAKTVGGSILAAAASAAAERAGRWLRWAKDICGAATAAVALHISASWAALRARGRALRSDPAARAELAEAVAASRAWQAMRAMCDGLAHLLSPLGSAAWAAIQEHGIPMAAGLAAWAAGEGKRLVAVAGERALAAVFAAPGAAVALARFGARALARAAAKAATVITAWTYAAVEKEEEEGVRLEDCLLAGCTASTLYDPADWRDAANAAARSADYGELQALAGQDAAGIGEALHYAHDFVKTHKG